MTNPYHDENGRFCSATEMIQAINKLAKNNQFNEYLTLKTQYEEIKKEEINKQILNQPVLSKNVLASLMGGDNTSMKTIKEEPLINYVPETKKYLPPALTKHHNPQVERFSEFTFQGLTHKINWNNKNGRLFIDVEGDSIDDMSIIILGTFENKNDAENKSYDFFKQNYKIME